MDLLSVWFPKKVRPMKHRTLQVFSQCRFPSRNCNLFLCLPLYSINWEFSNFLWPYIWAKNFNSQISHLTYQEDLKTFIGFYCHTLIENIFSFPTYKITSSYGKSISDFSLNEFFSKSPALARLVSKNLFQILPLFDHKKQVLTSKSSGGEFEKEIFPALTFTLTLSPSTVDWFQNNFLGRLFNKGNRTGPSLVQLLSKTKFWIQEVWRKDSAQDPSGEKVWE